MRTLRVALAAVLALVLGAGAVAARGSGSIEGGVYREDGSHVGGVVVLINETNAVTLSDSTGAFFFRGVPAGTYSLSFTLGDNVASEEGVTVEAGGTVRVDKTVDWEISFAETITVMSASRRVERIVEAPAAVTLVTDEEIEQEAAHGQLPKLLEFTPGAEVTQSGIYDYNFNTRGFNSSLNRRVATLIDGRNPSVPFLGAQEWAAVSFPLDDLSSAELVRGPSAALYGANASSGVLNLVTKQPRYSRGGMVRLTAGELSTFNVDFRWAGSLGRDWYAKVLAGLRDHGDFAVSRRGAAEYSRPCNAAAGISTDCLPQEAAVLDPEDDDEITFGGLRLDKYFSNGSVLTLEGGQAEIEGPVFQTGIGRVQLVEVERPWARANFNTSHWNFLGSYTKRDAPRQTALGAGTNLVLDTERLNAEVQTNWSFADDRARLVAGLSYSEEDIDSFDPTQGAQTLIFEPISVDMQAAFAQLDWSVGEKVKLVLAARYDESDLHDSELSPKGALVYSITPDHTLRFTYNEAFQVPNYSEFFLQANAAPPINGLQPLEGLFCAPFGVSCGFAPGPLRILALGNADLEVEEVETIEIGYRGILGGRTFLTVDYYESANSRFITDLIPQLGTALGRVNPNFGPYQPPAGLPDPVADLLVQTLQGALGPAFFILTNNFDGTPFLAGASYANFGDVDTEGFDVGLSHYFDNNVTFSLAYSWFDFEIKEDLPGFEQLLVPNTPKSKWSAGLAYASSRWDASFDVRWVDDFRWAVGPFQGDVRSYTTVDLSGNYEVGERVKIGVTVANLTDKEHWEAFGGDLLGRRILGHVTFDW